MEIRADWLAQVQEAAIEPERPIVDPHHHFFESFGPGGPFPNYALEDLWADTASHNVEQTVYVQCGEHYRTTGPDAYRPVGETEWVDAIARRARADGPGRTRVGGMVGTARLLDGEAVRGVLEAHLAASPLFRGIRDIAAWGEGEGVHKGSSSDDPYLYENAKFREGFAQLAPLGLSFDGYHYHTQLPSLVSLARAFPETQIICDHLGTPLGIGPFAGQRQPIFEQWRKDVAELGRCENVSMKLGGMLMPWNGWGWDEALAPPTSDEFVAEQGDYYHHAIDAFGPERCMFESNFPVDKASLSYGVLWNAFKKIAARYSEAERESLLRGTAMRVYRLEPVGSSVDAA